MAMLNNLATGLGSRCLRGGILVFLLAGPCSSGSNPAQAGDPNKPSINNEPALPAPDAHARDQPPIVAALEHLQQALALLEKHANPLFGNYQGAAMDYTKAARAHVKLGIAGNPGTKHPETVALRALPAGSDFPDIRTVLARIRAAQNELKKVRLNLNGHRRQAIIALNFAMYQLDLGMKHARKLTK